MRYQDLIGRAGSTATAFGLMTQARAYRRQLISERSAPGSTSIVAFPPSLLVAHLSKTSRRRVAKWATRAAKAAFPKSGLMRGARLAMQQRGVNTRGVVARCTSDVPTAQVLKLLAYWAWAWTGCDRATALAEHAGITSQTSRSRIDAWGHDCDDAAARQLLVLMTRAAFGTDVYGNHKGCTDEPLHAWDIDIVRWYVRGDMCGSHVPLLRSAENLLTNSDAHCRDGCLYASIQGMLNPWRARAHAGASRALGFYMAGDKVSAWCALLADGRRDVEVSLRTIAEAK